MRQKRRSRRITASMSDGQLYRELQDVFRYMDKQDKEYIFREYIDTPNGSKSGRKLWRYGTEKAERQLIDEIIQYIINTGNDFMFEDIGNVLYEYYDDDDIYSSVRVGASKSRRRRAIRAASMRDDFETSTDIYTDDGRRIPVKIIDGWDKESKLKSQIENLYDELVSKFGEFWELSPNRHHPRAELLDQYIAELADLEGTSYEDVASRYLVQASTRVRANRKSRVIRAASNARKIPYDLVSTFVILRDYADLKDNYVNKEHELLCDIADALYNVGGSVVSGFSGEYRELYDEYGKAFFDKVLDDIYALDSQVTRDNVDDLVADVNAMLKGW